QRPRHGAVRQVDDDNRGVAPARVDVGLHGIGLNAIDGRGTNLGYHGPKCMNSPERTASQFFGGNDSTENARPGPIVRVPRAVNESSANLSRAPPTMGREFAEATRL